MREPIEPRETEVLIQKYVSGALTPEEALRLLARLKAQPSVGEALLRQMEIDLLLRELTGLMGQESQPKWSSSSLEASSGPSDRASLSNRFAGIRDARLEQPTLWVTGLAAALALVAGYWLWPEKDNQPRLRSSSAGVEVQRGEERLPAARKLPLQRGDIIETGPGQSAVIEFAREGTRLELRGETRLSLLDLNQGKHFVLHRGELEAVVAPQPAGERLAVATPQG